jgi:hypothetical protein
VTTRTRVAVLVGCAVVAVLVAWYAGSRHPPSTGTPAPGTVRLGPEAGEEVAAYLARLPATLPPDGTRAPALVQLSAPATPSEALDAGAGATPVTVVFRVPLRRVQTALRFVDLEPGVPVQTALDNARARAERAATVDADRLTGRPGAVAAAEAAALAGPDCRCVVALVVDGDRAGLTTIAGRAPVRAVEAAPPGTTSVELALSPLLPEQTVRADPLPDDGPVLAAP